MKRGVKGFGFIELMVSMLLVVWALGLLGRSLMAAQRVLVAERRSERVTHWLKWQMAGLRMAGGQGEGWTLGDHQHQQEDCLVRWTVRSGGDGILACTLSVEHPGGALRERLFWYIPFPEGV